MFYALSKSTGKKLNSLTIEENASYNFLKDETFYADPDEIESCPKEININKIDVKFREGKEDVVNFKGTQYDISPHFYIPNKSKLGINTIPESKEHKLAKNWIYNRLKKKDLIVNYSKINKPYKYQNSVNLFELPLDKEKIGIEVTTSKIGGLSSRRADIICPFIKRHPILGNGIVIEIQFSKQKNKTKLSREYDWCIRGYSIGWLFISDFNEITENIILLKKDSVDISSFASLIKQNKKDFIKNLKFAVQEECRKIDYKKEEIKEYASFLMEKIKGVEKETIENIDNKKLEKLEINEEQLKFLVENKFNSLRKNLQPICPQCHIPMLLKGSKYKSNKFWGCSNFPECRCTSAYEE